MTTQQIFTVTTLRMGGLHADASLQQDQASLFRLLYPRARGESLPDRLAPPTVFSRLGISRLSDTALAWITHQGFQW